MSTAELSEKPLPVPTAHTKEAKMISANWKNIRACLWKELDETLFLSTVIMELNALKDECTEASVFRAVYNLGEMGLLPGSTMQQAYFCPRKIKGKYILQVELMYQGLLTLAYENTFLRDVHCEVALVGEECERWNDETGPKLHHKLPNERELTWDNIVGAYCIWHSRNGGHGIRWTGKTELAKIKNKAGDSSVWGYDPVAMCEKTPLKRAAKFWPKSRRLSIGMSLEDAIDSDGVQDSSWQAPQQEAIDLSKL